MRRIRPMRARALRRVAALAAVTVVGLVSSGCGLLSEPGMIPTPTPASSQMVRLASSEGTLPPDLQQLLASTVDMTLTEYDLPGASVGVWIPGQGTWTTATGVADVQAQTMVDARMSWPLRSITTSFTVTLLLQLADEGAVSLDDAVGVYVDGVTNGDEITLLQLATMSSGVAEYTSAEMTVDVEADRARVFTLSELNAYALGAPAWFAPGTQHVYVNTNANLLGAVIEKVTGKEYAEVLQERILDELDLTKTQYIVDAAEWSAPHPSGYERVDGHLTAVEQNPSLLGPAGAIVSTLGETRIWVEALVRGELLNAPTHAKRNNSSPLTEGPPYDAYGVGMGEALGWWGHNGDGLGYTTAAFHSPRSGATIVVFTNLASMADGTHPADRLFRRLAALVDAQG